MDYKSSYVLRQIPPELWARFKSRAQYEGIPMRALVLKLIEAYADGQITVNAQVKELDR